MPPELTPTAALHRHCPVCGSCRGDVLRYINYVLFDDLDVPGHSCLVSCSSCGFVFNDLTDGGEALTAYYQDNEHYLFSSTGGTGGSSHQELARYHRLEQRLSEQMMSGSVMLDVGCGKGGWLRYLASRGYSELMGLEASVACRRDIQASLDVPVAKHIQELPSDRGHPAIVVLSHILEHVRYPVQFLSELVDKSAADALFCLEVPNTPALLQGKVPWRNFYFEHINHFDVHHLRTVARLARIEPIGVELWPFLPGEGNPAACIFLLCRRNIHDPSPLAMDRSLRDELVAGLPLRPLSTEQEEQMLSDNRTIAIWGISQYAQLILGMHPRVLERITALFDVSPAKIGRRVAGIKIQSPIAITEQSQPPLLLLPQSDYTSWMVEQLALMHYKGGYIIA